MLLDLLGGRIQFAFDYPYTSAQHVRAGKLRALMVTSPKRVEPLPNVPTAQELGFPELEIVTWARLLRASSNPEGHHRPLERGFRFRTPRFSAEGKDERLGVRSGSYFAGGIRRIYLRGANQVGPASAANRNPCIAVK